MNPIPARQSFIDNAASLIAMGCIQLREGVDNYQKDIVYPKGKGKTTGSLGIISNWLADGYPAAMNAKL